MSRKSLWKDFYLTDSDDFHRLHSYWQSCRGAWEKYDFEWGFGAGTIETNLPYSELRAWFRFAIGKSLPDHVSSELPSWEIYKDD